MRFLLTGCMIPHLCLFSLLASAAPPKTAERTPLDDYVHKPDPAYSWKVEKSIPGNPSTTAIIKLTSQKWRDKGEVDKPIWEHWLVVVKPEKLKTNKAMLIISGGSNDRGMPKDADDVVTLARKRLRQKFFGTHPLALDAQGDEAGVKALSPADLVALHRRLCIGPNVVLAVAGDFDPRRLTSRIETLLTSYDAAGFPFVQVWVDSIGIDADSASSRRSRSGRAGSSSPPARGRSKWRRSATKRPSPQAGPSSRSQGQTSSRCTSVSSSRGARRPRG